jgi:hypothetical protein
VVTIATYSFFLAALVGRQYVEERSKSYQMEVDIYVPVFTILQFFFYMGLLKVSYLFHAFMVACTLLHLCGLCG